MAERTPCWRERDSNHRYLAQRPVLRPGEELELRAAMRSDGSGVPPCHSMRSSLPTRRWREMDSNYRSPVRGTTNST
jgi:hypothetical protein